MLENLSTHSSEENLQKIEEKLFGPASYTDGIVSLEQLDPNFHGKPTPLDPESVYVIGSPAHGGIDYRAYAELEIMDRLGTATESLNMPNYLHLSVAAELEKRLEVMTTRNQTSYSRLLSALDNEDHIDDAMLDIISRARQSEASIGELGMLLNSYPDMISVEFYKFTNPFRTESIGRAIDCIDQEVATIDHTAEMRTHDHTTSLYDTPKFINEDINDAVVDGVKVRIVKHMIGDIQFDDNDIEIIRKLVYVEDRDGSTYPIGVSGYLRAADYATRLERISPIEDLEHSQENEHVKKLGEIAIDMDMLGLAIQPQLEKNGLTLEEYFARVRKALESNS